MTPEYLMELADAADPERLWTLCPFAQQELSPEKRRQLDAGVALRRHAVHVRRLRELLGTGKSLLLTPLSEGVTDVRSVPMPGKLRTRLDGDKTKSQRMREAGFTRRPSAKSLPSDE